ncbi:unnamed protein product, partial [Iphiclides podalirius]
MGFLKALLGRGYSGPDSELLLAHTYSRRGHGGIGEKGVLYEERGRRRQSRRYYKSVTVEKKNCNVFSPSTEKSWPFQLAASGEHYFQRKR